MSSIWNSQMSNAGSTPFAVKGLAPSPGGGAAAKFSSMMPGAASPMAASSGTNGTGSSSDSGTDTGISANDFLTLLVTEMQNQDPTADTDPNEYINQLVQINSLEQLISINQNLATVLDAATPPATVPSGSSRSASTQAGSHAASLAQEGTATGAQPLNAASLSSSVKAATNSSAALAHGNLSAPADHPAAHQVARALDGRVRGNGYGHAIRDIPTRRIP